MTPQDREELETRLRAERARTAAAIEEIADLLQVNLHKVEAMLEALKTELRAARLEATNAPPPGH